jgi:putative peptidoglycan lipid II flippase
MNSIRSVDASARFTREMCRLREGPCVHLNDHELQSAVSSRSVNRNVAQSAGILMAAMLVSRALGFLRDWTVAHQLGSSAVTDAYYAAFTLPDMLSYLVAGGTLGMFFIPVFADYVAQNREDEAWHVYSTILTFMTVVFIALILIGEIFASQLVQLIAPGFGPQERSLVVFLTRLMLPAQLFLCLGSVMSSVQNAKMRFFVPALGSAIYNLGVVLGGWLLFARFGIAGFAFGLLAGAFCGYFLLQVLAVRSIGARFVPNLNLRHPGFLWFLKLGIPIMLALSSDTTEIWIIRWFGSFLPPASITWLTYSKALMSAPLVVVGAAMGTASYPFLAKLHSEGKFQEFSRTLIATLKGVIFVLIPVSAMAIVLCKPVVYFVFSHTRLLEGDFRATATALAIFSAGLFARGAQMVVSRGLYASHDTITPAVAGTSMTFLGLPLYWYCSKRWDYRGLAGASSLITVVLFLVLLKVLLRRTENRGLRPLFVCFTKVTISSTVAALVCVRLLSWIEYKFAWENMRGALEILVLVSAVGFLLILLLAKLLGVNEIEVFWKKFVIWKPKRAIIAPH